MRIPSFLHTAFNRLADITSGRSVSGAITRDPVTGIAREDVTVGPVAVRLMQGDPALAAGLAHASVKRGSGLQSLLNGAFNRLSDVFDDRSISGSIKRDPVTGMAVGEEFLLGPGALRAIERNPELFKALIESRAANVPRR